MASDISTVGATTGCLAKSGGGIAVEPACTTPTMAICLRWCRVPDHAPERPDNRVQRNLTAYGPDLLLHRAQ
jgi:hypothetical protein